MRWISAFLDENGEEIELSRIGEEYADEGKGAGFITAEDVGPTVLEEGDEDAYTLVDEDEIEEDFAEAEDDFDFDGIDAMMTPATMKNDGKERQR